MLKPLAILAEGETYIAVNKPSGLLMIPTAKEKDRTLVALIQKQYNQKGVRLYPCHRLDKETSGVVLFAKGKKNQQRLMALFQNHQIEKNYTAFIHGQLDELQGVIRRPIKDQHQRQYAQFSRSKKAVTEYHVLKEYDFFSVVDVRPITGRTNQIRIHFAQLKHPLVGESVYAFRKDFDLKFKRCALHSTTLRWKDITHGGEVVVHAPLPKDMVNFLEKQRKD